MKYIILLLLFYCPFLKGDIFCTDIVVLNSVLVAEASSLIDLHNTALISLTEIQEDFLLISHKMAKTAEENNIESFEKLQGEFNKISDEESSWIRLDRNLASRYRDLQGLVKTLNSLFDKHECTEIDLNHDDMIRSCNSFDSNINSKICEEVKINS